MSAQPSQTDIDDALEQRIEAAYQLGIHADDPEQAREAFFAMGVLISQRSARRVKQMEKERGLA